MRLRLLGVASMLALFVCTADAQSIVGITWDASPDPTVTGYTATVDGVSLGTTPNLIVPWMPSAAYHRICVASMAGTLIGAPSCIDYGSPPIPTPTPTPSPQVPDLTMSVSPSTITAGQSAVLSYAWNVQTRHVVRLDGGIPQATCDAVQCAGSMAVSPTSTTTYTLTAVLTDGTPVPSLTASVTVIPLAPQPEPTSWRCLITSTPALYANGDVRYTVRCPKGTPLLKGDGITVTR